MFTVMEQERLLDLIDRELQLSAMFNKSDEELKELTYLFIKVEDLETTD